MRFKHFITDHIKPFAQAGLATKGLVYCLLGVLAIFEAFNIGQHSEDEISKTGVFGFIDDLFGGRILLVVVGGGLFCYSAWRLVQAFADTEDKGRDFMGIVKRLRFVLSALAYSSLAYYSFKIVFGDNTSSGNTNQKAAATLLSKPFGQYLLGIAALVLVTIGVYQIFYALSEKYKERVSKAESSEHERILLTFGKIGFIARGIVWLLIAWLIAKAALQARSAAAGETAEALMFLQNAPYGSFLLATVGLGLLCYGLFNFVRVKYEKLC